MARLQNVIEAFIADARHRARAGVSRQTIIQSMGHRTLAASARYAHASIADKQAVIAKVFG